jgi:hypothetical protein
MILENAKKMALEALASLPKEYPDAELSIAGIENGEFWLGMGYLVGKGLATYRGGYSFRITEKGRSQLERT